AISSILPVMENAGTGGHVSDLPLRLVIPVLSDPSIYEQDDQETGARLVDDREAYLGAGVPFMSVGQPDADEDQRPESDGYCEVVAVPNLTRWILTWSTLRGRLSDDC